MSDRESLQERSERLAERAFLGGPPADFERVGRLTFEVLLKEGLRPTSRVLDVGCGALRVGYWLMRFLDSGCYFGLEPNAEMLELGLGELVEPEVVERADAHFANNADFDFTVFGASFDFVLARSIWTHASKEQIRAMLSSFAQTAAPGASFLATYHPASRWFELGQRWPPLARVATVPPLASVGAWRGWSRLTPPRGYEGQEWVGRSHQSADPGVIRHSLQWIAEEAAERGLSAQLAPLPIVNGQYWLRIRAAAS